jgi:polyisoprenoid-binding protein YceI
VGKSPSGHFQARKWPPATTTPACGNARDERGICLIVAGRPLPEVVEYSALQRFSCSAHVIIKEILLTSTASATELMTGTWAVDPSRSEAGFTIRHAGAAKARGKIAITEASITVGGGVWESSVTATLDAASVDTKESDRDEYVRGADLLDVEKFPVLTFVSTSVTGSGSKGEVTGDLTIHGVTRSVSLATKFNGTSVGPDGNLRGSFAASTELSRKDFDLSIGAKEAGGLLLGDKIKVSLDIEAVKQA